MENEQPVLVRPSRDADVEAMLAIYRRHIRRGIEEGVDDSGTPQPKDLHDRRKNLRNRRLPHLVATRGGEVVGYAYVVPFRKRPAYRYAVKHSIYVHHEHLGRGIGRLLMHRAHRRLRGGRLPTDDRLHRCRQRGFACVFTRRSAFPRVGLLPGVAYRYGRWADSVMVQRSLGAGSTAPPPPASLSGR